MDYANTTNVEFIVDPKVLFHGWLIYSYLQIFKLIKCKWLPGECADWFFDNIMAWSYCLHRWYSMSRQKNSILINEHALNREPVPISVVHSLLCSIKNPPQEPITIGVWVPAHLQFSNMTPRLSGHYWANCGRPVRSSTKKKTKTTNTRGGKTRGLGLRNYVLSTCFIRFCLARVFFVPRPPPGPSLKYQVREQGMAQWWERSPPANVAQFNTWRRRHMWVEFVVGSLPCSERFFSGYSGFPLSLKTNTSKFQFDLERTDTFKRVDMNS